MKLIELLDIIKQTALENKFSLPYIVGGLPRDMILKKLDDIKDVDITCGDASSLKIGPKVIQKITGATLMTFPDGHSKLAYGNFSVDFSNNFVIRNVKDLAAKEDGGVDIKTSMQAEIYSRDFTVNTLLMPLDMSTILDITERGIADIKGKFIDTCLEPEITLGADPDRIIRVIYLCAKLGFKPKGRVMDWIVEHGDKLSKVNGGYIKGKLNKALGYDKGITMKLITDMRLGKYIPESGKMLDVISGIK